MFLEKLVEAANGLFDGFWAIVIILLPIFFLIGLLMKFFGK